MNITWYTNTAQWSTIHDIRKPTKLIIQTKKKYVQKKTIRRMRRLKQKKITNENKNEEIKWHKKC